MLAYLLAILAGAVWYVFRDLEAFATSNISIHGYIALGLGLVLTLGLGIGLMALAYYSHKRGYDDDAHRGGRQPEDPD